MKPDEGSTGVEKTFINCFYRGVLCPVREMQFHVDGSFSVSMIEMEINNMIKMVSPDSEHITNITMLKTNPQETNAKIIERLEQVRKQNAALIAALEELIEIAFEYATLKNVKEKHSYPYYDEEHSRIKSAIDNAKTLLK